MADQNKEENIAARRDIAVDRVMAILVGEMGYTEAELSLVLIGILKALNEDEPENLLAFAELLGRLGEGGTMEEIVQELKDD